MASTPASEALNLLEALTPAPQSLSSLAGSRARGRLLLQELRAAGIPVAENEQGAWLQTQEPLLSTADIQASLPAANRIGLCVLRLTASTQQVARSHLSEHPDRSGLFAVFAEMQSAGRGRLARTWQADFAGSLLVSVACRMARPVTGLSGLSLAVGIGLAEALRGLDLPVSLKWPNDLLLKDGKLGGILIELLPANDQACPLIIGFGLNVRLSASARHAAAQASADLRSAGCDLPRAQIAGRLLAALQRVLEEFEQSGFAPFQARFRALDAWHDRPAQVLLGQEQVIGIARGVDREGRLLLDQHGTVRAFDVGEVSLRPPVS